jgi:two-component system heavy metal sensor histidine kinase CusS
MSLKNALESSNAPVKPKQSPRPWSLATRLTAWYAASAFALVLAAAGYLYWTSVSNLDREDDQLLGDRVRALRAVMASRPGDSAAIRREVEEEWEAHERMRVHMRIKDDGGHVVAETPGMNQLLPFLSFPAPRAAPAMGADFRSVKGRVFRVLAVDGAADSPKGSPYIIQVAMDRSLEMELQADYRRNLLFVLGAALVVCAGIGYQIARRGIRPIHQITDIARRIRPTNLGERIAPDGLPAELLTLADTFNDMLGRLEDSFARLSRFSADIAHELRTPVMNLRGEAEVALGKPRSPAAYREVIGSCLEECERLARIIDSLLFLARAECPESRISRERLDLARELAAIHEFYEATAAEAGIMLGLTTAGDISADLDRTLFQRAVGNLIENALAHTPRGGTVEIATANEGGMVRIEVTDTGCGIPEKHLPQLFDRFYRVDQARSKNAGGVGLGLAIVKSIATLHGGSVHVESEVGRGTRARLVFPLERPADNCLRRGNYIEDLHQPA